MPMKSSQLKKAPRTINRLLELRKEVIVTMEKRHTSGHKKMQTNTSRNTALIITLQTMTAPMPEFSITQTSGSQKKRNLS